MQEIKGTYASARVYASSTEESVLAQIKMLCNHPSAEGSKISVMPNAQLYKAGLVGLTMTVNSRVMPGLIGSDIGCGISYIQIERTEIEYRKLAQVIREQIPAGGRIRENPHFFSRDFDFADLICRKHIHEEKAILSLGTLGGGNHFLEVDVDEAGNQYVFAHSGSGSLGREVTEYYLKQGQKALRAEEMSMPYGMAYVKGQIMEDYLHDANEATGFAMLNREIMLSELAKQMDWKVVSFGESIHSYIDENRILRKGASSAYDADEVILAVGGQAGILLGSGKGNPEWNWSAPHSAGGALKGKGDLDSHQRIDEISCAIAETATIEKILKPVYHYKAEEERG